MAGQREWGWVSQQLGIPNFPQDFPDCLGAADLAQLLAAEQVSPVLLLLLVVLFKLPSAIIKHMHNKERK